MMREISKLLGNQPQGVGYLVPGDYERTVEVLMSSDSDPVITRKPNGAWSHAIWDAM